MASFFAPPCINVHKLTRLRYCMFNMYNVGGLWQVLPKKDKLAFKEVWSESRDPLLKTRLKDVCNNLVKFVILYIVYFFLFFYVALVNAADQRKVDTYTGDILFVHVSSPYDNKYVDANHAGDCGEDRHALEELLGREDRVEVDRVRRHVDVATERRQVRTQALCLSVRVHRH